jgi:hypothetical protein
MLIWLEEKKLVDDSLLAALTLGLFLFLSGENMKANQLKKYVKEQTMDSDCDYFQSTSECCRYSTGLSEEIKLIECAWRDRERE